jgi:hypothetical protein
MTVIIDYFLPNADLATNGPANAVSPFAMHQYRPSIESRRR